MKQQTSLFRSTRKKLMAVFEQRKQETVDASPDPVCVICKCCWFRAVCLRNVLNGHKPLTCCFYQLFSTRGKKEFTLEEVVAFSCGNKCMERQSWKGDPVPHTPHYCERYCPMTRYLLNLPVSNFEDVPHNFGY